MSLLTLIEKLESNADKVFTPLGDGKMVWHLWGCGKPLVLLHGGSGAWNHWIKNIEALSGHYRLLVPDLPGLGDSDNPPFFFDPKDYGASVPKLAEAISSGISNILGNTAFHLCGFSFGSIVGSYIAADVKRCLLSFTLVGASAFGWPWQGLKTPFLSMTPKMTEKERLDVQKLNLSNAMLTSEVGYDLARLQLDNVSRARLRTHLVTETNVLMSGLAKVKVPLNGIWGSEDIYAQPNLRRIKNLLCSIEPNAQFEVIEGAGHWVMVDAPEEFQNKLLGALEPQR